MNDGEAEQCLLVQTRDLALFDQLQAWLATIGHRLEALTAHSVDAPVVLVDVRGAPRPIARLRSIRARLPRAILIVFGEPGTVLRIEDVDLAATVAATLQPPLERAGLLGVLEAAFRLARRRSVQSMPAPSVTRCVLLIEDDPDHAALMGRYLRKSDAQRPVLRVGTLGAALDALREHDVELILADLSLPDALGLDVVRRLRAREPAVPIIVTSALIDDALALEALRAGADDCLHKEEVSSERLRRVLDFASERGQRIGRLAEQACSDALTQVSNHAAFRGRLEQALARARRRQSKTAVLFLDLDGLKAINDSRGHLAGDRLLRRVAERLRRAVRRQDVVARLGGDEFAVLMEDVADRAGAERLAERALQAISSPLAMAGEAVRPRCSIGISLYPEHGETGDELMEAADEAMYQAKRSGGARCHLPRAQARTPSLGPLDAEGDQPALLRRALCVFYQPRVRLDSDRVIGVEALLRCRSPTGECITASEAVPRLQRAGLLNEAGRWLLSSACRQLGRLREQALTPLALAVNISPCELHDRELPAKVDAALRENGLPPEALELEVGDPAELLREPVLRERIVALRSLGVRIALDHAGSSDALRALFELPCQTIKLDTALVRTLGEDERARVVTRRLIEMAHELGLRVVAEGVETAQQLDLLRASGCDDGQGFLFGAPADSWQPEWSGARTLSQADPRA